jgi:RNA-directed DNA polymerase
VVEVEELLFRGRAEVVDADLADYFGSLPHAELLKSVTRRVVDRRALHLIEMWLDAPLKEPISEVGRHKRPRLRTTDEASRRVHPSRPCWRICTCAGLFGMEEARAGAKPRYPIVTYADDLVILCRRGKAEEALQKLRAIMGALKLTEMRRRHESAGSRQKSSRRIERSTATQPCGYAGR